jgi:predicted GNAT family acetyltransferase
MTPDIRQFVDDHRWEIRENGQLVGLADYELDGDVVSFTHTETLQGHGGRGVAKRLVTGMLDDARAQNLSVLPYCWFVAKVIAEHPAEYLGLVPNHRRAQFGLPAS